jgi:hypothetical protein
MPSVLVRLRAPEWTLEQASQLAEDIMATGQLNYTNNEGAVVNVEVGDVTVES